MVQTRSQRRNEETPAPPAAANNVSRPPPAPTKKRTVTTTRKKAIATSAKPPPKPPARKAEKPKGKVNKRRLEEVRECMINFAVKWAKYLDLPTEGRAGSSPACYAMLLDISMWTAMNLPKGTVWPSVEPFILTGGPKPSIDAFWNLDDVRLEIYESEARVRENLAQLVRWSLSDADAPDDEMLENWDPWKCSLTLDELEARDDENLELLLDVSSIFTTQRTDPRTGCEVVKAWVYPEVLCYLDDLDPRRAISSLRSLRPYARSLAAKLNFPELQSIFDLQIPTTGYICLSCPLPHRTKYVWRNLVRHVAQHCDWYAFLVKEGVSPLLPNAHDLEVVQVEDFGPDHLRAHGEARLAARVASQSGRANCHCGLCPAVKCYQRVLNGEDLVALNSASEYDWVTRLHLKEIHGLEGAEADRAITNVSPSEKAQFHALNLAGILYAR